LREVQKYFRYNKLLLPASSLETPAGRIMTH
jgi:hypothetical protein